MGASRVRPRGKPRPRGRSAAGSPLPQGPCALRGADLAGKGQWSQGLSRCCSQSPGPGMGVEQRSCVGPGKPLHPESSRARGGRGRGRACANPALNPYSQPHPMRAPSLTLDPEAGPSLQRLPLSSPEASSPDPDPDGPRNAYLPSQPPHPDDGAEPRDCAGASRGSPSISGPRPLEVVGPQSPGPRPRAQTVGKWRELAERAEGGLAQAEG